MTVLVDLDVPPNPSPPNEDDLNWVNPLPPNPFIKSSLSNIEEPKPKPKPFPPLLPLLPFLPKKEPKKSASSSLSN